MSPLAAEILAYLRGSIAQRGGTGRRPSKIALHMEGAVEVEDLIPAIRELQTAGLVRLEENEIMGWYVILREAEA